MGEHFDPSKPSIFIQYLDANNLYGWTMCLPLPVGNFKWMKNPQKWRHIPYILEVELEYPKHLHDLHNDFPLAPENVLTNGVEKIVPNLMNKKNIIIREDSGDDFRSDCRDVSHCHRQQSFSGLPSPGRSHYTIDCHSRVQTLYCKKNYVVHCQNLTLNEELGLKRTKIHRGISFDEKPFMKGYIDLNTKLRSNAKMNLKRIFSNL